MKRRIVQFTALLFTNSYFAAISRAGFYQGALKGVCVPVLNCYACPLAWGSCPIGALQHFIIVRQFPFYVLGILGLIGVFVGRFPCGWLCPFGWFQEIVYKLKLPKFSAPNWLRHMKYVVLVVVCGLIAWWTYEPWFCKICPAGTLEGGLPWLLWQARGSDGAEGMSFLTWVFGLKVVILAALVLLMGMMRRPFCRFICPLGALLGLSNKFSLLQMDTHLDDCAIAYAMGSDFKNCASCMHCSKDCPMGLKVPEEIGSVDCIRCMNCT
ncbi:MAG: 4Fe-4S binding protein, partial [Candidatus Eisenbacteria sp.]|nr:4Fe-4S binding protein [Candidatus Eisenbacteria bacterium]